MKASSVILPLPNCRFMVQPHPLAYAQFVGKAHRSETKFEKGASDRNSPPGYRKMVLDVGRGADAWLAVGQVLGWAPGCWLTSSFISSSWLTLSFISSSWLTLSFISSSGWLTLSFISSSWLTLSFISSSWLTLSFISSSWLTLSTNGWTAWSMASLMHGKILQLDSMHIQKIV